MSDYKFTLPYPPSINGYWRTFRNRQIISKRGRDYIKLAAEVMDCLDLSNEKLTGDLSFKMTINPPTLRAYDIDNFTKGVFDALTKCGFWLDDGQVQQLTAIKGVKIKGGSVDIEVTVLD